MMDVRSSRFAKAESLSLTLLSTLRLAHETPNPCIQAFTVYVRSLLHFAWEVETYPLAKKYQLVCLYADCCLGQDPLRFMCCGLPPKLVRCPTGVAAAIAAGA